jgi:hypothetical protein
MWLCNVRRRCSPLWQREGEWGRLLLYPLHLLGSNTILKRRVYCVGRKLGHYGGRHVLFIVMAGVTGKCRKEYGICSLKPNDTHDYSGLAEGSPSFKSSWRNEPDWAFHCLEKSLTVKMNLIVTTNLWWRRERDGRQWSNITCEL